MTVSMENKDLVEKAVDLASMISQPHPIRLHLFDIGPFNPFNNLLTSN